MRKVVDNCIYNLQALSAASGREEFTVQVHTFGDGNAEAGFLDR